MIKIALIIGSTRPNRFGPKVAAWIADLASSEKTAEFTVVDLADINLPMLDEPAPPMTGNYQNEHTKSWAKVIGGYDGFVFITPEYNYGYPASLKNALDFLYAEWNNKPVAFISYGASAGGARAVEQLRAVIANVRLFDLNDHVAFVNYWEQLDQDGALQPTEAQTATAKKLLTGIAFWGAQFKRARAELAETETK